MIILDLPPSVEKIIIADAYAQDLSISEYILQHLPKRHAVNKQWQWLDTLRTMPKDETFEQAVLEGRKTLRVDERDWSTFG